MSWKGIIKTDDYDEEHHNKVRIGGEYWAENLEMLKSILEEYRTIKPHLHSIDYRMASFDSQYSVSSIEHAIRLIDGWIKEDR